MANTAVSTGQLVTAAKGGELTAGTTAPASPTLGWLWLDENYSPPVLRVWTGQDWINTMQHDYRLFGTIAMHSLTLPKSTISDLCVFDNINLAADQSLRILAWGGVVGSSFSFQVSVNADVTVNVASSQVIMDGWVADVEINPSKVGYIGLYGYVTSYGSQPIPLSSSAVNKVTLRASIDGSATSKFTCMAAAYIRY